MNNIKKILLKEKTIYVYILRISQKNNMIKVLLLMDSKNLQILKKKLFLNYYVFLVLIKYIFMKN